MNKYFLLVTTAALVFLTSCTSSSPGVSGSSTDTNVFNKVRVLENAGTYKPLEPVRFSIPIGSVTEPSQVYVNYSSENGWFRQKALLVGTVSSNYSYTLRIPALNDSVSNSYRTDVTISATGSGNVNLSISIESLPANPYSNVPGEVALEFMRITERNYRNSISQYSSGLGARALGAARIESIMRGPNESLSEFQSLVSKFEALVYQGQAVLDNNAQELINADSLDTLDRFYLALAATVIGPELLDAAGSGRHVNKLFMADFQSTFLNGLENSAAKLRDLGSKIGAVAGVAAAVSSFASLVGTPGVLGAVAVVGVPVVAGAAAFLVATAVVGTLSGVMDVAAKKIADVDVEWEDALPTLEYVATPYVSRAIDTVLDVPLSGRAVLGFIDSVETDVTSSFELASTEINAFIDLDSDNNQNEQTNSEAQNTTVQPDLLELPEHCQAPLAEYEAALISATELLNSNDEGNFCIYYLAQSTIWTSTLAFNAQCPEAPRDPNAEQNVEASFEGIELFCEP